MSSKGKMNYNSAAVLILGGFTGGLAYAYAIARLHESRVDKCIAHMVDQQNRIAVLVHEKCTLEAMVTMLKSEKVPAVVHPFPAGPTLDTYITTSTEDVTEPAPVARQPPDEDDFLETELDESLDDAPDGRPGFAIQMVEQPRPPAR